MSRQRVYHCNGCRKKWPGYCAPKRCLCGHQECPAAASYIDLGETRVPAMVRRPTNNAWANREEDTWIDKM